MPGKRGRRRAGDGTSMFRCSHHLPAAERWVIGDASPARRDRARCPGVGIRALPGAVMRLVSRREGTLIVAGFAERDAVPRRQSLKGISIRALGSHRRWIPRVPTPQGFKPEGIVYSAIKRTGLVEHHSGGWGVSIPGRPLVECQIVLPEDPSKCTGRSQQSRPVSIETDTPFRIGRAWGR